MGEHLRPRLSLSPETRRMAHHRECIVIRGYCHCHRHRRRPSPRRHLLMRSLQEGGLMAALWAFARPALWVRLG